MVKALNSAMYGLRNFDFETHCSELSAKKKRKLTDEEYAALTLMMLSRDHQSSYTGPTASLLTAQNIEDKINPDVVVDTTSERITALTLRDDKNSTAAIAALASSDDKNATTTSERTATVASSDDKKPMETFSLAKNVSYQELGGHMPRHYDGVIGSGKKSSVITSESALEGHMPSHHDSVIGRDKKGSASSHCNSNGGTLHDFDLNLPAAPEIDVQVLGGQMPRHSDGVIGSGNKSIVIPSESALGGHMPSHHDSVISCDKKGSASSHCNRNMGTPHDFDLNLPAAPEIDDQESGSW
ncbi:zinc finger protein ZAT6-like [Forsythia ovata]|uniref:Zinc finger protein ZAT6-like n=1 Tax=Forsythia ovata TaxID=205694 RepID=A0ABD1TL60_9LAMI